MILTAFGAGDGHRVGSIAGRVGGGSVDGELSAAGRNQNLLLVGSRLDEDALCSCGACR